MSDGTSEDRMLTRGMNSQIKRIKSKRGNGMRVSKHGFVNLSSITICAMVVSLFFPGYAFSQEPVYKGKTITLVQGRAPGGSGICG